MSDGPRMKKMELPPAERFAREIHKSPEMMYPAGAADAGDYAWGKTAEKAAEYKNRGRRHPELLHGNRGSCFVATAVYGSYDCPEVVRLRGFRDNFLKKYALGRAFITAYYRFGPYLAKMVKGRAFLSTPTKAALDLFIRTFLEKKRP